MAKQYPEISDEMAAWIRAQPLFFCATAPLSAQGHINLSPRGLNTLRVLGPKDVAWLDLTGSGNETAAHLAENGRLTIMFCAFDEPPRILRLYGKGTVVLPGSERWATLRPRFPDLPGERQIIHLAVEWVQTSCGAGVPLMDYQGQRDVLITWAEKKGEAGVAEYQQRKNTLSIDGLPAPGMHAPPER